MSYVPRGEIPNKSPLQRSARVARFALDDKVDVYWHKHPIGTYQVRAVRESKDGKSTEYQLGKDGSSDLYEKGAWVGDAHLEATLDI